MADLGTCGMKGCGKPATLAVKVGWNEFAHLCDACWDRILLKGASLLAEQELERQIAGSPTARPAGLLSIEKAGT
jgi:hypothetical protein